MAKQASALSPELRRLINEVAGLRKSVDRLEAKRAAKAATEEVASGAS